MCRKKLFLKNKKTNKHNLSSKSTSIVKYCACNLVWCKTDTALHHVIHSFKNVAVSKQFFWFEAKRIQQTNDLAPNYFYRKLKI